MEFQPHISRTSSLRSVVLPKARRAARMMLRRPLFTLSALLLLALAISANTILFSVLDAVWFRPLPFHDPGRLMAVWERPPRNVQWKRQLPPFEDFLDLQKQSRSFDAIAAASPRRYALMANDRPESVAGDAVTAGSLPMLGVPALKGRTFLPKDKPGTPEAVLSYQLWSRVFGGRDVVGQSINLNSKSYAILGVMPPNFPFPSLYEGVPELWTLLASRPDHGGVSVIGRLRPSVPAKAAESEATGLLRDSHNRTPASDRPQGMIVRDLQADRAEFSIPLLAALSAAVALLLLIACSNVAALLLGRASERKQEMAVRYSLGAARARIVRQLLTENILLWALAGLTGLLLSFAGLKLLLPIATQAFQDFPQLNPIAINSRAATFTLLLTLGTGVVFGLVPALQGSRHDIAGALKEAGRGLLASRRMNWWRKALVASQVSCCVILLIGAALLLKSLVQLTTQPLGFHPGNDLTFKVELTGERYQQPLQRYNFYDRLLQQMSHLPGVASVGSTSSLPLQGTVVFGFSILGHPAGATSFLLAGNEAVSPDYFRTIGITVLAGRAIASHDSEHSEPVAVINQTLSRRYFSNESPIGKRIKLGDAASQAAWMTVVGIVADVKHAGLDWDYLPEIYLPYRQLAPEYAGLAPEMFFVVRALGRTSLNKGIRTAVASLDRNVPVVEMIPMGDIVSSKELPSQLNTAMFGAFAVTSLLLAAIGLYAIVAQSVLQRRKEIGIRIALGATPAAVIANAMREGMLLGVAGAAIGLAGAFALIRLIRSILFGVTATDPLVFVGVPLLLLLVASLASFIPALRAASADPLEALRCE